MDKKFLKEKNLLEAHKHFMSLCEWSYVPQLLDEDDDEEKKEKSSSNDNNDAMGDNDSFNNNSGDNNNNNDTPNDNMGDDKDMQGDDNNFANDNVSFGDNDNMSDKNDNSSDTLDDNDMLGDDNDIPNDDSFDNFNSPSMEEDDEEVIDVDDLTNAQEKMNTKVNDVGHDLDHISNKIKTLLQSIDRMEDMINKNNAEINKFKQEFVLRNPTEVEKINLRSLDSFPFNTQVSSYWDKKNKDIRNKYYGYSDNNESTVDEYELTNKDVDDYNDKEIEDSFTIDDDLKMDLQKIFNY